MKIIKVMVIKYFIKFIQLVFYIFGIIGINIYHIKKIDILSFLEEGVERVPFLLRIKMPKNVRKNSRFTAGKSITFFTDLNNLEIMVLYRRRVFLKNMTFAGTSGIDIYLNHKDNIVWKKCLSPSSITQMRLKDNLKLEEGIKKITIFLPPYAQIAKLILLNGNKSQIWKDYTYKKKFAVYGSSISQGCAASRPGLSYTNLLAQRLNMDVCNYGFSEGARGEEKVIEYIFSKKKYIWILIEYDHNSKLKEFLNRHISIYKKIRETTDVPIIFLSRISGGISNTKQENKKRVQVIEETMKYADRMGDRNVFFINGDNLIDNSKRKKYLEDDRHPNDLGMELIANKIEHIVRERIVLDD